MEGQKVDRLKDIGDIPNSIKILMVFIDRVGFPIMAFLLMFYMSYFTLKQVTGSINEATKVLVELKASVDRHNRISEPAIERILGKDFRRRSIDE